MKLDKFLAFSGVAGPVIFVLAVLIFGFISPGYDQSRDLISELGALENPFQNMANLFLFFVPGIFIMLFGIGLYRRMSNNWRGTAGALLLITSGIMFAIVVFLPCDAGCNNISVAGRWHEILSNGALYLAGIALFLFALRIRDDHPKADAWFFTLVTVGAIASISGFSYPFLNETNYAGLVQRIAVGIPFILTAFAAVDLYKNHHQ